MRRVHICIRIGLGLGAAAIAADRYVRRLPAYVAISLYAAAAACFAAGMLLTRAGR